MSTEVKTTGSDALKTIDGDKGHSRAHTTLRSRAWFDNPDNADMTALYLERYMNFGLSQEELQSGRSAVVLGGELARMDALVRRIVRAQPGIRIGAAGQFHPGSHDGAA